MGFLKCQQKVIHMEFEVEVKENVTLQLKSKDPVSKEKQRYAEGPEGRRRRVVEEE